MARKYDIIERLKEKNERPFIILDEEHKYSINTSKTNVMSIMAIADDKDDKQKDDFEKDIKTIEKIIELALGKSAFEYIISQDYTFAVYESIIDVIMAAISDKDLDDLDKSKK